MAETKDLKAPPNGSINDENGIGMSLHTKNSTDISRTAGNTFESPDKPLNFHEKVRFISLLVFINASFIAAVVLASIYNM